MTCEIPSFVRDYVSVTSWAQGHRNFFPGQESDNRIQMIESGELVIQNITKADHQRALRCRAVHTLTGETKVSEQATHIYVTDARNEVPPTISDRGAMSTSIRVRKGSSTSLLCPAHGTPPPKITWKKTDLEFGFHSRSSNRMFDSPSIPRYLGAIPGPYSHRHNSLNSGPVLHLNDVDEMDQGTYTCTANNTVGVAYHQIRLQVMSPLNVRVTPSNLRVSAGKVATFHCSVTGSPMESLQWLKNGKALPPDGRTLLEENGHVLKIVGARASDEGVYQCKAKRKEDSAVGGAIFTLGDTPPIFQYRFIEQTMQPGPSASLKCIASGRPTPSLTWSLDGFPITHLDRLVRGQFVTSSGDVVSHVNISSVSPSVGGRYYCTAMNSVGSITHSARLNVYGLPIIRAMDDIETVAGGTMMLNCPVGGYPIHYIKWTKENKPLPINRRQNVFDNGTLIVQNVQTNVDEGSYECMATARGGHSSTQAVRVKVVVPPRILPFPSDHDMREGSRLTLTCSLSEGDFPLTFEWFWNNQHLLEDSHVTINKMGDFSSYLVVMNVQHRHSGNYTCNVSNLAGTTSRSTSVYVRVPPRWDREPLDITTVEGNTIRVDCKAEGFPVPTTSWKRKVGNKPGSFSELFRGNLGAKSGIRLLSNGSLILRKVKKEMAGKYLCEANNGIGPGLSKVVNVVVQAPPTFLSRHSNVSSGIGEKAIIVCDVTGDLPLDIMWYKDGNRVEDSSFRYSTRQTTSGGSRGNRKNRAERFELVVKMVDRSDDGIFVCTASNLFGSNSKEIRLMVLEPPSQPQALHVINKGSRFVKLGWKAPRNGNNPLTQYTLKYRKRADTIVGQESRISGSKEEMEIGGHLSGFQIDDLEPARTYFFSLIAHNEIGSSKASENLEVTLDEEPPGGAPQKLRAHGLTSTSFRLSWEPPESKLRHGKITSYRIGIRKNAPNSEAKFQSTSETSMKIDGMNPYTEYSIVGQAVNSQGRGPLTHEIFVATPEDAPSVAPSGVTCSPMTSKSLLLSWDPLSERDARGKLLGFKISYYKDGQDSASISHKTTPALNFALKGLQPYTNYTVRISAFTSIGEGPDSVLVRCSTEEDVPGMPAGIKGATAGSSTIIVSWRPPSEPNGKLLTYTLNTQTLAGASRKFTVHHPITFYKVDLEPNVKSVVATVAASTRIGEGPYTKPSQLYITEKVPAKIVSWSSDVSIHRLEDATLPCVSVGIPRPIIHWKKEGRDVSEIALNIKSYPDGSLVIRNANKNDTANYTCGTSNMHGVDSITYSLLVQMPPSAPQIDVNSAGKNSISVSWNSPSDGGSPLLGVTLSYKEDFGGWKELSFPPSKRVYTLTNLACGRNFQVFATVFNKVGEGTPSEIVNARTAGIPPFIDQRSSILNSNATCISVELTGWRNGGCPITHFGIAYRKLVDSTWVIVSEQIRPTERIVEIGGLLAQTSYMVRVTAHNSAGITSQDYTVSTTTINGELPSQFVQGGFLYFMKDVRIVLPLVASFLALISACVAVSLCLKRRPIQSSTMSEGSFDAAESFDNSDKQKEHFYATIKKHSPPYKESQSSLDDCDDSFHQYATCQVANHAGQRLPQQIKREKPTKEDLANCHYRHQDVNQKRTKPGDDRDGYHQRYRPQYPIPNPSYCSFAKFVPSRQNTTNEDTLDSSYLSVECDASLRRHGRLTMNESDEYDTFGSDSDIAPVSYNKKEYSYQRQHQR